MERRYVTNATADRLRREALELFDPSVKLSSVDRMRRIGVIGVEYWLVPDDDPRAGTSEQILDSDTPHR